MPEDKKNKIDEGYVPQKSPKKRDDIGKGFVPPSSPKKPPEKPTEPKDKK